MVTLVLLSSSTLLKFSLESVGVQTLALIFSTLVRLTVHILWNSIFQKRSVRQFLFGKAILLAKVNVEEGKTLLMLDVSSFSLFPSSPSVTTDDRKQFQCSNMVFGNKTKPIS